MALVKVPKGKSPGHKEVMHVLAGLRLGEPVALPTKFGYVFACEAGNRFAIKRLKDLRNDNQPTGYSVLFSDINQLENFSHPVTIQVRKVLTEYWKKLLTVKIQKNNLSWDIGDACRSNYFFATSCGDPFILEILNNYGPLVISSASAKGWPSFSSPEVIEKQFSGRIHTVIGTRSLEPATKSTVITEFHDEILLLREGEIRYSNLVEKFPDIKFKFLSEEDENVSFN
jgi:L-threonylcarbamoyladenylate synthase